ncbi:hypothetical protein, partial [Agromyces sp. CCNWLW208]|uniref:hypothetical protein n=1 Tax=Agromyces sp. CCNWLW208 TaxID=3125790 RepID=UPI0030157B02
VEVLGHGGSGVRLVRHYCLVVEVGGSNRFDSNRFDHDSDGSSSSQARSGRPIPDRPERATASTASTA